MSNQKCAALLTMLLIFGMTGCGVQNTAEYELPAVLFYVERSTPQDDEGGASASSVTFITQDGTVYSGKGGFTKGEIAAMYEADTLADHYTQTKCGINPEEAAAQYRKVCEAAESDPHIIYPDGEPAVEETRTFWYTEILQQDGTWQHLSMGEDFCGAHYPSNSKQVNEAYEWFSAALTNQ